MTDTLDTTFAALAIAAQVASVVVLAGLVAALGSPGVRGRLVGTWGALSQQATWAAWFVAAVATGGSMYFSEIANYLPCPLCWYQRIAMYPLAIILLVGALLRDRRAGLYALVFPLVGAGISIHHIYIEVNPDAESATCRAGIPCSTRWIDEFGYVTIPVMALSAFVLIALLSVVALLAGRRAGSDAATPGSGPAGTGRP